MASLRVGLGALAFCEPNIRFMGCVALGKWSC